MRLSLLLFLLAAPVFGESPNAAKPKTLAIAAAANLKSAAEELKAAFEREQPGAEVSLTLGASGAFFAQLQNGAPFDLFLSADREYPDRLVALKLAAASLPNA